MTKVLLIPLLACLACAQQRAADTRPVIVAFGDSLSAGYGAAPGLGYAGKLQRQLDAAGYSYRVVNLGIPGDTSAMGRSRMSRVLALHPAMVVLEFGGNDRSSGLKPARTQANLDAMIRMLRIGHVTVVLAQAHAEQGELFAELARKYKLTLIPKFLEGVEGEAELLSSDGRHPNAEGYSVVANTVMTAILPLLEKPARLR